MSGKLPCHTFYVRDRHEKTLLEDEFKEYGYCPYYLADVSTKNPLYYLRHINSVTLDKSLWKVIYEFDAELDEKFLVKLLLRYGL